MKKIIIPILVLFTLSLSPSVVSAAWWNPFSWQIFHPKTQVEVPLMSHVPTQPVLEKNIETVAGTKPVKKTVSAPEQPVVKQTYVPPMETAPKQSTEEIKSQEEYLKQQKKYQQEQQEVKDSINALNKKIIDIKKKYYEQVDAIRHTAIPLEFQQGRIDNLTESTNEKINEIQLEIQELELSLY